MEVLIAHHNVTPIHVPVALALTLMLKISVKMSKEICAKFFNFSKNIFSISILATIIGFSLTFD